jgi:hypothetical protein
MTREISQRLVVFQVAAFAALEVAERLGAGAPLSGLATSLPTGLVIQTAVAAAIAAAVRWLLRATDVLVALASPDGAPPASTWDEAIPAIAWARPVLLPASVGGRAPPRVR